LMSRRIAGPVALDGLQFGYFTGRMRKNARLLVRSAIAVAFALSASACESARSVPPGYQGIVELDERRLGFEVPGRLAEVPVQRGQLIQAGQLIARLDETLEQPVRAARAAELEAARAQVALLHAGARAEDVRGAAAQERAARATLAKVQTNLARARRLLAGGAVNQSEVDNLEQDERRAFEEVKALAERVSLLRAGNRPEELAAGEAKMAAAAATLAAEDEKLKRFVLRSDAPAAVVDVHLDPGEIAAAGAPVVTVADTAHPYVDVFVPTGALSGVVVGTVASVRVDGEPAPFAGKVEELGQKTEFTPRFLFSPKERPNLVVRVRVRIDDPERRLHAGIPAFAKWVSP
jgi:HlyD family secretion protein